MMDSEGNITFEDKWKWAGVFNDNSRIVEGDINSATGRPWSHTEFDLANLKAILFIPIMANTPRVALLVREGDTPTRFCKRYISVGSGETWSTWVLQVDRNGESFYSYFLQDGNVILSTKDGMDVQLEEKLWHLP